MKRAMVFKNPLSASVLTPPIRILGFALLLSLFLHGGVWWGALCLPKPQGRHQGPPAHIEIRLPPAPVATPVAVPPAPPPTPLPLPVRAPRLRASRKEPPVKAPPPPPRGGLSEDSLSTNKGANSLVVATGNSAEKAVDSKLQGQPLAPVGEQPVVADPFAGAVSEAVADAPAACAAIRAGEMETTEEAARAGVTSGFIIAEFIVDKKGKVGGVKIIKGVGYGVDERVLARLAALVCSPAKSQGEPLVVRKRIEFEIVLQ